MDRLIELLKELSVRTGDFTLKSGMKSDLYVDVRKTALHGKGSVVIADAVVKSLIPEVEALGGVELGAVPIVGSAITYWDWWSQDPTPLPGFIIRKAVKGHGTQSKIENCPPEGTPVCIIEDVTTTGGSLERAIVSALHAGLKVVQVITVVDRQETFTPEAGGPTYHGAEKYLRAGRFEGVFTALTTRKDLVG